MQHGTVCVILDDGASNCPDYLLPKKKVIEQHVAKTLTSHDRFQLMMLQSHHINLNHLMNVQKLMNYYNARQKANVDDSSLTPLVAYTMETASRNVERFSDIAKDFYNTMNRLTGLQYQILGTSGDVRKAARMEFKATYAEAVKSLNRLGSYHLVSPLTDQAFYSQSRLMRVAKREGVYVNDLPDIQNLQQIARNAKWLSHGVLGLGVLASVTDVMITYKDGGDWREEGLNASIDLGLTLLEGAGLALLFTPSGWLVLFVVSVAETIGMAKLNTLITQEVDSFIKI